MLGTVSPKHFQCAGQVLTVNPRGNVLAKCSLLILEVSQRREERGERREAERREERQEERGREERREAERREERGERIGERGEERFWWRVMQISLSCCDRCQLTSQDQLTSNQ